MDNINESRQTQTGATSQESQECFDPSQSQSVATILTGDESYESGQIGRDRGTSTGFFAGKRSLDEAILYQLLAAAQKGLKNAEACITWYEEEKREFEKQVSDLEQLILTAQEIDKTEISTKTEEE